MKPFLKSGLLLLAIGAFSFARGDMGRFPILKGPYLGQNSPNGEAVLFAPGIVSTGMYERDMAITANGDEIYYGLLLGNQATVMVSRLKDGRWTEPEIASFASDMRYQYFEPSLTRDGKKIFFLSSLTPEGKEALPGWGYQNIWAAERREDGTWGKPFDLGFPINAEGRNFFPSVTDDGTLYFTRAVTKEFQPTIYRSRLKEGKYSDMEKLPDPVNGNGNPYNAFIAPDESYLIACAADIPGEAAGTPQYYVYFRTKDDHWSRPVNLGEKINKPGAAASSAYVTRDGKYLFFASTWKKAFEPPAHGTFSLGDLLHIYTTPQNGNSDIYWIDAGFIQELGARVRSGNVALVQAERIQKSMNRENERR
jgi:hypothetical protein